MPLLLCDLDNTLIDRSGLFVEWATRWSAERGLGSEFRDWLVEHDGGGGRSRIELWTAVKQRLGLTDSVLVLVEAYYADFTSLMRCSESVLNALVAARKHGWRIAIVTNGEAPQADKIEHAGLRPLVDAVCISGLDGVRKPHPRLFELAAARCESSLEGAWMIGDDPIADIGGAIASGASSVWLSLGRSWPAELPHRPTAIAESFPEAVTFVMNDRTNQH